MFWDTPTTSGGALDEFISGGNEFVIGGYEITIQPMWVLLLLTIAAVVFFHFATIKSYLHKGVCAVRGLFKSSTKSSTPATPATPAKTTPAKTTPAKTASSFR